MVTSLTTVFLSAASEAFFGALASQITDGLWAKLKGDPAKKAFKKALGAAIHRYSITGTTGTRLGLVEPLLQEDGPLFEPTIVEELTHLVRFDREPNAELIGERWRAKLIDPPLWRDFTFEAKILLGYLREELQTTEVFRPVFEAQSLDAIVDNTAATVEGLASVEQQLTSLRDLLASELGTLNRAFALSSVHELIYDFSRLVEDKTDGFVGRQFVFEAIDQFIENNPRGYFIVRGDPGIGKSALAAQLVKSKGYLHHFNVRAEGINKTSTFLQNICAQLIAAYDLAYMALPPNATQDANFLNRLLNEVSAKLDGKKCVIVIDALDEVDETDVTNRANVLYLPLTLPEGIFIVATTRREELNLRFDISERTDLFVEQDDDENVADIREYVVAQSPKVGIQIYIANQGIDDELFIDHLVEKSQGNFIYLRMVLPEIEKGAYQNLAYEALPQGLVGYYEDQWHRMRRQNELDWFDHKLPVILALTVVKEPVSIVLLENFSGIANRQRVRAVLHDFDQFIYKVEVEDEDRLQRRYRWYHASFFEFIAAKEEIADERVDLVAANRKITNKLWKDLFQDE